jgi:hypothetical protein
MRWRASGVGCGVDGGAGGGVDPVGPWSEWHRHGTIPRHRNANLVAARREAGKAGAVGGIGGAVCGSGGVVDAGRGVRVVAGQPGRALEAPGAEQEHLGWVQPGRARAWAAEERVRLG